MKWLFSVGILSLRGRKGWRGGRASSEFLGLDIVMSEQEGGLFGFFCHIATKVALVEGSQITIAKLRMKRKAGFSGGKRSRGGELI